MSCRSIELSEAMAMRQKGLDSIVFFEDARKAAEEAYAKNPLDAEVISVSSASFSSPRFVPHRDRIEKP